MRRAQIFALDLIMATVLFIAIFAAFYGFLAYMVAEPEDKVLVRQGQQVVSALDTEGSPANVIDAQELNVTKLEDLTGKDYDTLRAELGLRDNFCLYIEDDEGNLVQMSDAKLSQGSQKATLKLTDGETEKEISCGQ